jgi:hypothetical protein
MKKSIRIALGSAVLAGGLAVVGASPANAQVRFEGSFPLPHGRISIGVGGVGFGVGSYVPYGYNVYNNPDYGYGFEYGDQWIPCEQYGTQWVIVASPISFVHRDYAYGRTYRNGSDSFSRDSRRFDSRSWNTRASDSRSWNSGNSRRDERQVRDNRASQPSDRQSRDQNRRSR